MVTQGYSGSKPRHISSLRMLRVLCYVMVDRSFFCRAVRRPPLLQEAQPLADHHLRPRRSSKVRMSLRAAFAHACCCPVAAAQQQLGQHDAGLHMRVMYDVGMHRGSGERVCVLCGCPERKCGEQHSLRAHATCARLAYLCRSKMQHRVPLP